MLFIGVFSTVSCTIQKRQRLTGYHIEWNSNRTKTNIFLAKREDRVDLPNNHNESLDKWDKELTVDENESNHSFKENEFKIYGHLLANMLSRPQNDTCDLIITADGDFIYASAIEEDENLIRFTSCDTSTEDRKVIAKELVFMIKYKDGSKIVLDKLDSKVPSESVRDKSVKKERNKGFQFIDEVAFVGFIFGAASIPVWFFHWQIGFFISIFAILMGVIGIIRILKSKRARTGLGFAIASLLLGLGLFIATLVIHITAFI